MKLFIEFWGWHWHTFGLTSSFPMGSLLLAIDVTNGLDQGTASKTTTLLAWHGDCEANSAVLRLKVSKQNEPTKMMKGYERCVCLDFEISWSLNHLVFQLQLHEASAFPCEAKKNWVFHIVFRKSLHPAFCFQAEFCFNGKTVETQTSRIWKTVYPEFLSRWLSQKL